MKGLKFIETWMVSFEKQLGPKEKIIKSAYFNSKAQTIINKTNRISIKIINTTHFTISQWISEGSVGR